MSLKGRTTVLTYLCLVSFLLVFILKENVMAINWKTFTQRPYVKSLSLEEQVRLFNIANQKSINHRKILSEQASQTSNSSQMGGSAGDGLFDYKNLSALQFDGVDDKIHISEASGSLEGYYNTISAWVKPYNVSGADQAFLSWRYAGSRIYTEFRQEADGKFLVGYRSWGDRWRMETDNAVFSDNTWTHIAVVQNGEDTDPILYVNGTLAASSYLPGLQEGSYRGEGLFQNEGGLGAEAFQIGGRNFNGALQIPFEGALDHISIWSRALSASEIATAYGGGKIADIASLNPNIWFKCNEGSGTVINSAGSSAISGSLGASTGTALGVVNSEMWSTSVLTGAKYYWGADKNTPAKGY